MRTSIPLFLIVGGLISCAGYSEEDSSKTVNSTENSATVEFNEDSDKNYNLQKPDEVYNLPEILREISGISIGDDHTFYCVQDENGTVYRYDTGKREIVEEIKFGDKGDYEDVYFHNNEIMVLRSDGTIFTIASKSKKAEVKQTSLETNCDNNEGFTYDKAEGYYYMACKEESGNGNRIINKYSREDGNFKHEGHFEIKISEVEKHHNLSGKKEFNPSAIAVHPISNEIYILSSEGIMVVWKNNNIKEVYNVPSKIYNNAEGLTFAPNGDLYISSEGEKSGKPTGQIFYFKYNE